MQIIDFISSVLERTAGDAVLLGQDGAEFTVGNADAICIAIHERDDVSLALTTAAGDSAGFTLVYDSLDEAMAARDRYGDPSFALYHEGRDAVVCAWLLDQLPANLEAFDALCVSVTGYPAADQAIPTPGFDGWSFARDEYAVGRFQRFSMQALAEKFAAPERMNDAILHGTFDESQLDRTIVVATGKMREQKEWNGKPVKLGAFLSGLTQHRVGPKNGACFVLGATIGGVRRKTAIEAVEAIGLDVDNGTTIPSTIQKLVDAGITAVMYSTHSHMKAETDVSENKVLLFAKKQGDESPDWADLNLIRQYLAEVRGYTPEIVQSVSAVKRVHAAEGLQIRVTHAPMQKFRIVVPLAAPFVFAKAGLPQNDVLKLFGRKVLGLGRMLGLAIDEACLDPSRLFYAPRHQQGAPFEAHAFGGRLISFDEIPEAGKGETSADPFAQAAADMGVREKRDETYRFTPKGTDLWAWQRQRGIGFELADVFRAHGQDAVRFENTSEKLIVTCPFDEEHSNPGDPADGACMVMNASDRDGEGFFFGCQHATCKPRSRTDMLCEAIRQGTIPEEVLHDDSYLSVVIDTEQHQRQTDATLTDDGEATKARVRQRVSQLNEHTSVHEVSDIIKLIATSDLTSLEEDQIVKRIKEATGSSIPVIKKDLKEAKRRHLRSIRTVMTDEGEAERTCIELSDDAHRIMAKALAALTATHVDGVHPTVSPYILQIEGKMVRLVSSSDGNIRTEPMNEAMVQGALMEVARFVQASESANGRGSFPLREIASQILVQRQKSYHNLRGIVATPFFDQSGHLIDQKGYDAKSGYYYHPHPGLEIPPVGEAPTIEEALQARDWLLNEVLHDFPFDGEDGGKASRTTALAFLLQFFMRHLIQGPTPVYFVSKPAAGTGAGLLIDTILRIATGVAGEATTEVRTDDERKKVITSTILSGSRYLWLDNINHKVDSAAMASAITSGRWSDRKLGTNELAQLDIDLTWIFCGNNVAMSNEIRRRCLYCRLDAKQDPTKRHYLKPFKHEDLPSFIDANRGHAIWCCLTIIRHWLTTAARRPFSGANLASFSSYSKVMGGIMEAIGMENFMGNLDQLAETQESEASVWEGLMEVLWDDQTKRPLNQRARPLGAIDGVGPWDNEKSLQSIIQSKGLEIETNGSFNVSLGKSLGKLRDNAFTLSDGTQVIFKIKRDSSKKNTFWLERSTA